MKQKKIFLALLLLILFSMNIILVSTVYSLNCSPGLYCRTQIRQECIVECGGFRHCENWSLISAYCDADECRQIWEISCREGEYWRSPCEEYNYYCDQHQ